MARLKAAGAVIIGKTNITAFSLSGDRTLSSWDGATFNAVNPELIPGASSAGTATATAAGVPTLGLRDHLNGCADKCLLAQHTVPMLSQTAHAALPICS